MMTHVDRCERIATAAGEAVETEQLPVAIHRAHTKPRVATHAFHGAEGHVGLRDPCRPHASLHLGHFGN